MLDAPMIDTVVKKFVKFLETGETAGVFTDDVFTDFTLPRWRLQAEGAEASIALRRRGHPGPGTVPRWRCEPTPNGFALELEERWRQDGQEWYCREMFLADIRDGAISKLSVYCTGDWDEARVKEHAQNVQLSRP
jgi:hypothetical protein